MKQYISLLASLVVAAAFIGCSEDNLPETPAQPNDAIRFSVAQDNETRTEFNGSGQLVWKQNDQFSIWCNESKPTSGAYKLTSGGAATGGITAVGTALKWGSNGKHTFYAAYGTGVQPKDAANPANGVIKCPYNSSSDLTISTTSAAWSNMNEAYMVCKYETAPVNDVKLTFKPIMTMYQIDVQGMNGSAIYLSSIEITVKADWGCLYKESGNTYFDYNIKTKSVVNNASDIHEETYKFNFPTTNLPKLDPTGKITLTAILPPIDVEITKVVIRSAGWGTNTINLSGTGTVTTVSASTRKNITLPKWQLQPYVDLGTAGKWATCNVGANLPTAYGGYYAWGEIAEKTQYTKSNSDTDGQNYSALYYGYTANDGRQLSGHITAPNNTGILKPAFDVAVQHADYGKGNTNNGWRMPTREEQKTLASATTVSEQIFNTVYGLLLKATNGNCIFLPAGGYKYESGLKGAGSGSGARGDFWSSTPTDNSNGGSISVVGQDAFCMGFEVIQGEPVILKVDEYVVDASKSQQPWYIGAGSFDRYRGRSVRAVYTK
ncbi:MAG: hypothetical protein HUK02_07375 [Bacteroidaceae bacterium]|nr:hypothetical protein [Bacteroidaceae bacterium]